MSRGTLFMMSMLKSTKRNLLTLVFTIILSLGIPIVVMAATHSPYGFTYDDSANGKTMYRYYTYSEKESGYVPAKSFYSKGTSVYTAKGSLVCNTSYASGSKFNGFDDAGTFYIITKAGGLTSIDLNGKTKTVLTTGTRSFNYSSDDLINSVVTSSGTKSIKNLEIIPDVDDDEYTAPEVVKKPNRVEIFTNSAEELVYNAYRDGKLKTSIVTSKNGKNVLNATSKVRLSDTLVGAKFMGFDSSYNVYLYETNGTLYRFKSGSWYSAEKISLSGTFKSFKTDDNGFISKIVTSKGSYTIKQLTTSNKWKANKTYTVRKSGYVTLYTKGSSKSNTLTLKSNKLSLNGKQIATGVSKYGFTKSKKIIYIKSGKAYTATISSPTKTKHICTKAKKLTLNKSGLVTKVVLVKGSKKVS